MCQFLAYVSILANVKQFQDLNALSLKQLLILKLTLHVGTSPARRNFSNTKLEREEKKSTPPVTEMRERTH